VIFPINPRIFGPQLADSDWFSNLNTAGETFFLFCKTKGLSCHGQ
jgi:hypothetical protein